MNMQKEFEARVKIFEEQTKQLIENYELQFTNESAYGKLFIGNKDNRK